MNRVLFLALAAAGALAFTAAVVFGVGDRETFVSPPEAIAEDYIRALATGRYDVAMRYADAASAATRDEIREKSRRLREQTGPILSVDVPRVSRTGDRASVGYKVKGVSGREVEGTLHLTFDRTWRVTP